MNRLLLVAIILAVTATAADARRRHHRQYQEAPVGLFGPGAVEPARSAGRRVDPMRLVPRDWQLLPPDPNWQGRRYVSPQGDAWLAFYSTPAEQDDVQARFKALAFGDGEQITLLHGERDRLAVMGLKGDKLFFRKVVLACGGTSWRHVAMEYPAAARQTLDRTVRSMSRSFEHVANDGCGDNLFASPQPASYDKGVERVERKEPAEAAPGEAAPQASETAPPAAEAAPANGVTLNPVRPQPPRYRSLQSP